VLTVLALEIKGVGDDYSERAKKYVADPFDFFHGSLNRLCSDARSKL